MYVTLKNAIGKKIDIKLINKKTAIKTIDEYNK